MIHVSKKWRSLNPMLSPTFLRSEVHCIERWPNDPPDAKVSDAHVEKGEFWSPYHRTSSQTQLIQILYMIYMFVNGFVFTYRNICSQPLPIALQLCIQNCCAEVTSLESSNGASVAHGSNISRQAWWFWTCARMFIQMFMIWNHDQNRESFPTHFSSWELHPTCQSRCYRSVPGGRSEFATLRVR